MDVRCSHCGAPHVLRDPQIAAHSAVKFRCSKCGQTTVVDLAKQRGQAPAVAPQPTPTRAVGAPGIDGTLLSQSASLALPEDRIITISVIAGPSKGLAHQLTKPRVVVGRVGGGADIQVDDPEISRQHCVVEVKRDEVCLSDLDSTNGTYIADQRVSRAELGHMSEFRSGASLFLVTIILKRD